MRLRRNLPHSRMASAAAVVGLLIAAVPAKATPLGSSQVVTPPQCPVTAAAPGADGIIRAFATCPLIAAMEPVGLDDVVLFIEGAGSEWRVERTLLHGRVLAVAVDGGTTFAAIASDRGLSVISRSSGGDISGLRVVDPLATNPDVSLVARGGRWWIVWAPSPIWGGPLFQARTLGGTGAPERITGTRSEDFQPSLLVDGSGAATLAWSHFQGYADAKSKNVGDPRYEIRLARWKSGRWRSNHFSPAAGKVNYAPSLAALSGRALVSFVSDRVVQVAEGRSFDGATFVKTPVGETGSCSALPSPLLAASDRRAAVAWSPCSDQIHPPHVMLSERTASGWPSAQAVPDSGATDVMTAPAGHVLIDVLYARRKLVLLTRSLFGMTLARTEE
ncbi:MAG: hypothetical protein LC750_08975 [Actinobacteria bacterium]|nr:hypothetical protein [Actinomycetota bacterium]